MQKSINMIRANIRFLLITQLQLTIVIIGLLISYREKIEMIFCFENYSDILWKKIVLVMKKNFWKFKTVTQCINLKNILRSQEKTFQTMKDQSNFWKRYLTCIGKIKIRIGTHYWYVETYSLQEQVRKYRECTIATYLQNIQSNLCPFEYL